MAPISTTMRLTSVDVVLREHDHLASCVHIAMMIEAYVDQSAKWTIAQAACKGFPHLLTRLGTQQLPIYERQMDWAMRMAADKGDLQTVQWLSAYRPQMKVSTRVMDSAAFSGHLEMIQWLHANRSEGCSTHAMDSAAACGHLEIVQWLHANRKEGCTTAAMDSAAAGGHLKVLQWFAANRREGCSSVAVSFALFNGHLDVVQWLEEYLVDVANNRNDDEEDDAMDGSRASWRRSRVSSIHAYEQRSNSRRGSFSLTLV
ncbi:Myosin light chain kinase-related, partial [Globisporangium splendens]